MPRPLVDRLTASIQFLVAAGALLTLPACMPISPPAESLDGYEREDLPTVITASYVRESNVYVALLGGRIQLADDRDLSQPWRDLGNPLGLGSRMLFVARSGTLFTSADNLKLWRGASDGSGWAPCLDVPVWRMDEDDLGNLYAGNYQKSGLNHALVYKSTDDGRTWSVVYEDRANDHIHTVRWDQASGRVYIAIGDSRTRGQAYSDDRGATWHTLAAGPTEGDTDLALTPDYLIWCSDDQSGRVNRVRRTDGDTEQLFWLQQFMWFGIAGGGQVFIGTSIAHAGQRAVLLASDDQGATWQTVHVSLPGSEPYAAEFFAESRELSADGWLYYTLSENGQLSSYRIRHVPTHD